MFESIVGYTLALASTLTVLMIPVKLFKSRNSNGVSYLTSVLAFYSMVSWTGYTMNLGDRPAYFSSLGPLICWGLSLAGISISRGVKKLPLSILSILILLSSLLLLRLPLEVLGVLSVTGSVLWAIPQVKKSLLTSDLSGISSFSYFAIFLENLGWILYAFLTGHYAYALAPLVQAPAALIIALKASRRVKIKRNG